MILLVSCQASLPRATSRSSVGRYPQKAATARSGQDLVIAFRRAHGVGLVVHRAVCNRDECRSAIATLLIPGRRSSGSLPHRRTDHHPACSYVGRKRRTCGHLQQEWSSSSAQIALCFAFERVGVPVGLRLGLACFSSSRFSCVMRSSSSQCTDIASLGHLKSPPARPARRPSFQTLRCWEAQLTSFSPKRSRKSFVVLVKNRAGRPPACARPW